jgi:hypothetical protein
MSAMVGSRFGNAVRDITPEEMSFFRENGWVKLERLISPELASEILSRCQRIMGPDASRATGGGGGTPDPQFARYASILRNYLGAWKVDPMLKAFAQCPEFGKIASRLRHDRPVQFLNDEILVKVPVSQGGKATPYHQDIPHTVFDRSAMINIWIALVELTPARGAMQFLSGSHRAGVFGRTLLDEQDAIEQYPELLKEHRLSEPLHLHPGDATIHNDLTIHGAPENISDSARWAYLVNLFDAKARYNGAPSYGEQLIDDLRVNQPLPRDRYPLVYPVS